MSVYSTLLLLDLDAAKNACQHMLSWVKAEQVFSPWELTCLSIAGCLLFLSMLQCHAVQHC